MHDVHVSSRVHVASWPRLAPVRRSCEQNSCCAGCGLYSQCAQLGLGRCTSILVTVESLSDSFVKRAETEWCARVKVEKFLLSEKGLHTAADCVAYSRSSRFIMTSVASTRPDRAKRLISSTSILTARASDTIYDIVHNARCDSSTMAEAHTRLDKLRQLILLGSMSSCLDPCPLTAKPQLSSGPRFGNCCYACTSCPDKPSAAEVIL